MNTKVIAIALVAIIVGAGAVVVITQMGGGPSQTDRDDGRLMIYGNANNDDYLDSKDVDYLKKIIDGSAKETQFADANQDGKINQDDVAMVEKMVKREKMDIYYYNVLTESADKVSYPVKSIVPIVNETTVAMKILGKTADCVGIYSVPDERLFDDVGEDVVVFTGTGKISIEALSECKPDAVVTLSPDKYVTNEDEIEKAGISVLRFDFRNPDCSPAYLTAGYILDVEKRSQDFVEFTDRVLGDIQKKVNDKVGEKNKVKAGVFGYSVIYGNISGYGNMVVAAGAINAVDWYDHRKVSEGYEWLYNYDIDWIAGRVGVGGYDYTGSDADKSDIKSSWDKHYNTYKLTDAVVAGHLMLLNTSTPDVIKAVYMAEQFYPEVFSSGYADKIHQEYVDKFIDNLHKEGYKVTDGEFCITQSDIKA